MKIILSALLLLAFGALAPAQVSIVIEDGRAIIGINGKPFTTFYPGVNYRFQTFRCDQPLQWSESVVEAPALPRLADAGELSVVARHQRRVCTR